MKHELIILLTNNIWCLELKHTINQLEGFSAQVRLDAYALKKYLYKNIERCRKKKRISGIKIKSGLKE